MIPRGIAEDLSPLESDVLQAMLTVDETKVRDLYGIVSKKKKVALTSVAVILDRLYEKGLVKRRIETCRGGTRYLYSLKKSAEEIEEDYMKQQVDKIISTFGSKAVAYFHQRFSK